MSASIARYLKDFSVPEPVVTAASARFSEDFGEQLAQLDFLNTPTEPARDIEQELAASFEEGRSAATLELQDIHLAERAAADELHQNEIMALKDQFFTELGEKIEANCRVIRSEIAERLTNQVTQALIPVLTEKLAKLAATELADKVISLFNQPGGISLVVHGPTHLFEIFNERMSIAGFDLHHIESDDIDLTVEFDDSVMVTRIAAWVDAPRSLGS